MVDNRDRQRRYYQLTINNPVEYGYNHEQIKQKLIMNFKTLQFFCMADEIGEQGTYHTHVYIVFSSRVRFSKLKKHFQEAHIEATAGNHKSNIEYVKKDGKWKETRKAETSVAGTYEEWGELPVQNGDDALMKELYSMVTEGYTNAEMIADNPDFIKHIDKLDKVRTTILIEKYKNTRRLNLKVIYISGATSTGKTRGILDEHGDGNVYRVSDYNHPFDGYACQNVICFDEFRSKLPVSDMLNYMDIYPLQLPARYYNKYACYNIVYIVSNWKLEEQYKDVQRESPETWKAFLRRISKVCVYEEDGTITTYNSVNEYMNRDLTKELEAEIQQLDLPFNKLEV
jgi:hypothetical protein